MGRIIPSSHRFVIFGLSPRQDRTSCPILNRRPSARPFHNREVDLFPLELYRHGHLYYVDLACAIEPGASQPDPFHSGTLHVQVAGMDGDLDRQARLLDDTRSGGRQPAIRRLVCSSCRS